MLQVSQDPKRGDTHGMAGIPGLYSNKNLRTPKLADDPWRPMKEREMGCGEVGENLPRVIQISETKISGVPSKRNGGKPATP